MPHQRAAVKFEQQRDELKPFGAARSLPGVLFVVGDIGPLFRQRRCLRFGHPDGPAAHAPPLKF